MADRRAINTVAAQEDDEADDLVPQLRAMVQEGRVHSCEGPLHKRTAKLKQWKKKWYRVSPGHHQPNIYHFTHTRPGKMAGMEKLVLTFPKTNPDIRVEPVSTDPLNPDFTSFGIFDTDSGDNLCILRADDIVQQRNFMAALGGRGPGLYTQPSDEQDASGEDTDSPDAESELVRRQTSYNSQSNNSSVSCPTYADAMEHLPREFYFPNTEFSEPAQRSQPTDHESMPLYDSSDPTPLFHRTESSTYLPPHGPAVFSPVVVGYGAEVGLRTRQMAVWDPKRHFYYFIDHELKTCFIEDPRPQKKRSRPILKRQDITYTGDGGRSRRLSDGEGEFFHACRVPLIVKVTAERAAQKPHAFTLRACGRDGGQGTDGREGESGENGLQGYEYPSRGTTIDGNPGGDGACGETGVDGARGTDGTKGYDIVVELSGSAAELCVSGSCDFAAKLGGEEREEVLFVDCRGGRGGDGGQGGDGGRGGNGGEGGTGAMGGDGGFGGDGGMGGDGGKGGMGGNTGSGGCCVIQTMDPRLLVLVEADCTTGTSGTGGSSGKGGRGGAAGFGGQAGPGNEGSATSAADMIHPGFSGKPGMSGCDGRDGEPGASGLHGNDGGISWVVRSSTGEVLHRAGTRYDAEVLSLELCMQSDNGLYMPNQQVCVSGITVVNSGGLPLPKGAKLSIPSTETVRFEQTVFDLPELAPNEKFKVPVKFHGRIFDQPAPNHPGEFSASASFATRIELLGRPFEKSVLEERFPVKYPIKIPFILSKSSIGCGEVAALEIGIQNVSLLPYGSSIDSGGSVDIRIHMDHRLIPLGLIAANSPNSEDGETAVSLPYAVTYNPTTPDCIHVRVTEIHPGETLVVPIAIQLESQSELYDTCIWQTELYFKGKLVEYMQSEVRVSPAYSLPQSAGKLSDVMMITNSSISKQEFAYWQRIFDLLGVSVDYWDASYHKQEESQESEQQASPLPPFKHMYAGKLVLYPYCNLESLPADEIILHFHGPNWKDGELAPSDSSMVLFCSPLHQKSLEQHFMRDCGNANLLKHLCRHEDPIKLPADAFSGHHLLSPGTIMSSNWTVKKREKSLAKKLEKEVPSQAVALMSHSIFIQPRGKLKYRYGSMDLRRCPLLRSCNFQCIDGAGGNMTAMGLDDPLSTPSTSAVPLASNFGQVFLATLCGLPLRCKLTALRTQAKKSTSSGCHLDFDLPNGVSLSTAEVVAIATASDVADELLSCSGETTKMKLLAEDIQEHLPVYAARGSLVLRLLELIKREATECRKLIGSNALVTRTVKVIHRYCDDVAALLTSSAADRDCTHRFPAMKLLQDSNRVLRCHQHTVEEDHYALVRSKSQ